MLAVREEEEPTATATALPLPSPSLGAAVATVACALVVVLVLCCVVCRCVWRRVVRRQHDAMWFADIDERECLLRTDRPVLPFYTDTLTFKNLNT